VGAGQRDVMHRRLQRGEASGWVASTTLRSSVDDVTGRPASRALTDLALHTKSILCVPLTFKGACWASSSW